MIGKSSASLLRRHVSGGAENRSGLCADADGWRIRNVFARWLVLKRLGQSEIEDLNFAIGSELDVGRLQVAVNDALLVRFFECKGDLPRD